MPADQYDDFVRQSIEMDKAFLRGTFSQWLEKEIDRERSDFLGDDRQDGVGE